MWKLNIVGDKATYVLNGKQYISRKILGEWAFQGRLYESPFEAFSCIAANVG